MYVYMYIYIYTICIYTYTLFLGNARSFVKSPLPRMVSPYLRLQCSPIQNCLNGRSAGRQVMAKHAVARDVSLKPSHVNIEIPFKITFSQDFAGLDPNFRQIPM